MLPVCLAYGTRARLPRLVVPSMSLMLIIPLAFLPFFGAGWERVWAGYGVVPYGLPAGMGLAVLVINEIAYVRRQKDQRPELYPYRTTDVWRAR